MNIWNRIEARLTQDIAIGKLRPGEQLATEHRLAQRFRVNRHTVRQALGSLAARGLVRAERGRGTFVSDFAVDYALGRRTRFTENLAAAGFTGRHKLLEEGMVSASTAIATALGLKIGTSVIRLLTVGEARGRPIVCGEHFFPARRFADLAERFERTGSISAALAELGVDDYARKKSSISARLLDAETARHLAQPAGRPALYTESVNVDRGGKPIEFARTWFAGDRVQLVVEPGG